MSRSATASSAAAMDSPLRRSRPGVSSSVQETYTGRRRARPAALGRERRVARFAGAGHGLAEKEVDARFERGREVRIHGTRLVVGWHEVRPVALRKGWQTARDLHARPGLVRPPAGQFPRKDRQLDVAGLEVRLFEIARDGRVAVGRDDPGAGGDVVQVRLHHGLGILQQRPRGPEPGARCDTAPDQFAAHAAVQNGYHHTSLRVWHSHLAYPPHASPGNAGEGIRSPTRAAAGAAVSSRRARPAAPRRP